MIKRSLLMLAAVLCMGGVASAGKKLPVKTIEVLEDGGIREILEQVGTGMTRSGGGQIVRKTITKIPGKIPWGGAMQFAPVLISSALDYFFNELKRESSGSDSLDSFWKNSQFPPAVPFENGGRTFQPVGTSCQGYDDAGHPVTVYIGESGGFYVVNVRAVVGSRIVESFSGQFRDAQQAFNSGLGSCGALRASPTLAELMRVDPGIAPILSRIIHDYVQAHPESGPSRQLNDSPTPTINQYEDELIDPAARSVPGPYGDGDYLREGLPVQPGNRSHPADGSKAEPWPDSPTPPDLDGDGVPDWRDGDDNGDGVPDDQQTPADQRARPGEPGYGRRLGDPGTGTPANPNPTQPGNPTDPKPGDPTQPGNPTDPKPGDPTQPGNPTDPKPEDPKPEDPKPCGAGMVADKAGKCTPEEKPEDKEKEKKKEKCEAAGREWDDVNEMCGDKKKDDKPVPNTCGDFSIPRLLQHTGSYLHDVVFPCENLEDLLEPITLKLKTKFPFSLAAGLNGWFQAPGGGDTSQLPSRLGIIPLEWGWLTPLWTIIKSVVGVALWAWFIYWLIDRFTPRTQI